MKKLITYIGLVVIGIVVGVVFSPNQADISHQEHNHSEEETVWTCSMHPQIRKSEFGLCPICGMDLTPLENDNGNESNPLEIKMSPTAMQLASVVTGVVKEQEATKELILNGKIEVDERKVTTATTHIGGRVEQLLISYTGEFVQKGQVIAYVYSPELVIAQNELLDAYQYKDEQPDIYKASRNKLKNWKVTEGQIDQILSKGQVINHFPVLSQLSGIVTAKLVNTGDHVMTGGPLFEIADLSTVWAMFDVYEKDISWIKVGDPIQFTTASYSGKEFTGKVSFIDPILDEKSRVVKARVVLNNSNNLFKPGLFLKGKLNHIPSQGENQLVVPKSAVLWTGKRSIVYVKTSSEQGIGFTLREVTIGTNIGDNYTIISGLKANEEIAIQGAFSIDAAAQLAGKPSMMNMHAGLSKEEISELKLAQQMEGFKSNAKWMQDWNALLEQYFALKDFLTKDQFTEAQNSGKAFKHVLFQLNSSELSEEQQELWSTTESHLKHYIQVYNEQTEILPARNAFKPLSEEMIKMVRRLNDETNTYFIHTCPMAVDNKDGDWLSKEKEVINPYMGSAMLRCGSLKEQIN